MDNHSPPIGLAQDPAHISSILASCMEFFWVLQVLATVWPAPGIPFCDFCFHLEYIDSKKKKLKRETYKAKGTVAKLRDLILELKLVPWECPSLHTVISF